MYLALGCVCLHQSKAMPSEMLISPIVRVRKLSFRQVHKFVPSCQSWSGWGLDLDRCVRPGCALMLGWTAGPSYRTQHPNSILELPVLVIVSLQELGPVGFLPPSAARETARDSVLTNRTQ